MPACEQEQCDWTADSEYGSYGTNGVYVHYEGRDLSPVICMICHGTSQREQPTRLQILSLLILISRILLMTALSSLALNTGKP